MRIRARINPLWEVGNILNSISDTIKTTFNTPEGVITDFKPRVDIWEDDFFVFFEFELPGMNKEEIKITINDDRELIVSGEKKHPTRSDRNICYCSERKFGTFVRAFQLPEELNLNKVQAKFENGVLTISIEKTRASEPKEKVIEVL